MSEQGSRRTVQSVMSGSLLAGGTIGPAAGATAAVAGAGVGFVRFDEAGQHVEERVRSRGASGDRMRSCEASASSRNLSRRAWPRAVSRSARARRSSGLTRRST